MPHYDQHLRGWLSYAFASEVFVIVSLTLFLPICLEQFARDNGRLMPDKINPCPSSSNNTTTEPESTPERCVVKILAWWIDTASFSLYVYSASVFLQALGVISLGGIADRPTHRKSLLLTFAFTGSCAAILFLILPSSSPVWFLSALLAITANVGFGVSFVALNAYLPSLAREEPKVVAIRERAQALHREEPDEDAPLIGDRGTGDKAVKSEYETELSRATSRISSLGIAVGYGAGIILLILTLIPVTKLKGSTFSLRLAIGSSGIWWAVFSLPAAIWLPSSAATVLTEDDEERTNVNQKTGLKVWGEVTAAWKRLGGMLHPREIRNLRNTFQYLAAWFLLSDGFATITSTAILFGKTSLGMSASSLVLIGAITPLSGIVGSLLWPRLQRKLGWSNLKVLVTLVALASVIPAYGCLGFLTQGRVRFGGLTTPGEMFGLAVYFGSVYGAFQGYARASYAEIIPPGEEARWYGLYSITDKSSSFLGPLIVALISDLTGNIRYSFFFLVLMVWMAIPILSTVNVDKGREDARNYRYSA